MVDTPHHNPPNALTISGSGSGSGSDWVIATISGGADPGQVLTLSPGHNLYFADVDHTDSDAIHTNVAGEISGITTKGSPTSNDYLLIEDAAAGDSKKSITVGDLSITESQISDLDHTDVDAIHDNESGEISALTGKTTPSTGDFFILEDSAASFAKKSVTYGNLQDGLSITESQISDLQHTDALSLKEHGEDVSGGPFTTLDLAGSDYTNWTITSSGTDTARAEVSLSLEELRAALLPRTAAYSQDGTQSSTSANSWVEFNLGGGALEDAGLVILSTGTGQDQGKITLKAGHAYRVHCFIRADVVNNGSRLINFRKSDGTDLGSGETRTGQRPPFIHTYDTDLGDGRATKGNGTGFETVELTSDLEFVLEFVSGYDSLQEAWVFIMEVAP